MRISEALEVPLTYILSGAMDSSENFLDEDLANIFKGFTSPQRRLLLDIAKAIAQNVQI